METFGNEIVFGRLEEIHKNDILTNYYPVLAPREFRTFKQDYKANGAVGWYILSRYPFSASELKQINKYSLLLVELSDIEYIALKDYCNGQLTFADIIRRVRANGDDIEEHGFRELLLKLSEQRTIYWMKNINMDLMHQFEKVLVENNISSCLSSEILYSYIKYKYHIPYLFAPSKVALVVTDKCNAKCKICYRKIDNSISKNPLKELTTDEIYKLLDTCASFGLDRVKILGGEPFLRSDIFDIIEHVQSLYMSCGLSTNGIILADYNMIKELEKKKVALLHVQVSLDGVSNAQDFQRQGAEHQKVLQTITNLANTKVPHSINTVVTRYNMTEIEEIVKISAYYNTPVTFQVLKLCGCGSSLVDGLLSPKEQLELINKIEKWADRYKAKCNIAIRPLPFVDKYNKPHREWASPYHRCRAYCYSFAVNPYGFLMPCEFYEPFQEFWDKNVRENNILDVWHQSPIAKRLRMLKITGKCLTCAYNYMCEKGCPVETLTITGDLTSSNPLCWFDGNEEAVIPDTNDFFVNNYFKQPDASVI